MTAVVAALVLAGAAACAGAASMTWWTAGYTDPLTGPLVVAVSGAQCLPELVPVALIALAGLAATLATQGWLRRLVGLLLVAGGVLVAVRAGGAMAAAPIPLDGSLVRPADPAGPAALHPAGPLLALAGGILVALAGALVVAGLGGRRRLGTRYDAPTGSTGGAAARVASTRTAEPGSTDVTDWWKALDAGADPTVSNDPEPGGYHEPNERAT